MESDVASPSRPSQPALGQATSPAPRAARTVAAAVRLAAGTVAPPSRATLASLADVDIRPAIRHDPWHRKLGRRLVTMPAQLLLTVLWWGLAPLALLILLVGDLRAGRPLSRCRFYLWFGAVLFGQAWGLCLLFAAWVGSGFGWNYRANNRWSLAAERLWARWNADVMARLFGISYEVEGSELLRDGPTILLSRHASTADTILPIGLITSTHGVRLRIILKAELLWAPIVDAIGHRMPFAFIKRGSADPRRELAACAAITTHLHPQESILIFPEGTRFTAARREALIRRLRDKHPAAAAEAEALTHVLPLRHAGTLALMQARPDADLVFCAHTGYEGSAAFPDFANGGMVGVTVKVKFWRVAAASVPTDPAARVAFLDREWRKVNAFVAAKQAPRHGAGAGN